MGDKRDDCAECKCLEYIHLVLDGESTVEQDEYVNLRLSQCDFCLNSFEVESEVRKKLKTKLSTIKVPSSLADEIKAKIRSGNH